MGKPRVLITSMVLPSWDEVERDLRESGLEVVYNYWHGARTEDEMIDILQGIDGAVVSIDPFTPKVFAGAPQLKVVSRTGVGYDAIDVKAATEHGVYVCTTPGANSLAVAEFAFALMITSARQIIENNAEVRAGRWKRHQGHDLSGGTLGIVGLGSIGKDLAKRARAFGMNVLAYDIYRDEAFAAQNQVSYVSLEELLRGSDYVSLHLFLNEETRHLMNAERLAMMKPSAYLINTSRGGVVDAEALYEALKAEKLAGAALDVFDPEPLAANSPLRELNNVILAPHVAGVTNESAGAMGKGAAENAKRVLLGKPPVFAVNSKELSK